MLQQYKSPLNKRHGFTLYELIVVLSILALMAAIAIPLFFNQLNHAKIATHNANVATLKSAALLAIVENGVPETVVSWFGLDGTISPGYDPDNFLAEWPALPEGLTYSPGFSEGSTTAYQIQIISGGLIEISPAPIT